jgi:hypothetical protein
MGKSQDEISKETVKPAAASFKIAGMTRNLTASTDISRATLARSRSSIALRQRIPGSYDYGEARGGHLRAQSVFF